MPCRPDRPPPMISLALIGALVGGILPAGAARAECVPDGSGPLRVVSAEVDPAWDGLFTLQPQGWQGADIAHSIPLDPDRVLWLFGDTLVGTSTGGVRDAGGTLVNGSITVQDLSATGPAAVTYDLGEDPTGFFAHQRPPSRGNFYWTTQGLMVDGELFVFAMNVISIFEQQGFTILRVSNPGDPPEAWAPEARSLNIGDETRMFISALLIEGDTLYMMGFDDSLGARRTVLARAPVAALKAGLTEGDVSYWVNGASGPRWGTTQADLATVMGTGVTESTLTFHPELGRYLYVTYDAFAGDFFLSSAEAITGPWSAPTCAYHAPEVGGAIPEAVAYTGRLHPELTDVPGELVLSYVTNTWGTVAPLYTPEGAGLYVPSFVRLRVEADGPGAGCQHGSPGGAGWASALMLTALAWGRRRAARSSRPSPRGARTQSAGASGSGGGRSPGPPRAA